MHASLGDEYAAYYFSGVCARSFVIGLVIYIGYSLFLHISPSCYCLTSVKAVKICRKERFEGEGGSFVNQSQTCPKFKRWYGREAS